MPTLGASTRGRLCAVNALSVLSSSATCLLPPLRNIAKSLASSLPFLFMSIFFCFGLNAFLIASAATSPMRSSTSFLAPAILSAKVILSVGGASLANDFCLAVIGAPASIGP